MLSLFESFEGSHSKPVQSCHESCYVPQPTCLLVDRLVVSGAILYNYVIFESKLAPGYWMVKVRSFPRTLVMPSCNFLTLSWWSVMHWKLLETVNLRAEFSGQNWRWGDLGKRCRLSRWYLIVRIKCFPSVAESVCVWLKFKGIFSPSKDARWLITFLCRSCTCSYK